MQKSRRDTTSSLYSHYSALTKVVWSLLCPPKCLGVSSFIPGSWQNWEVIGSWGLNWWINALLHSQLNRSEDPCWKQYVPRKGSYVPEGYGGSWSFPHSSSTLLTLPPCNHNVVRSSSPRVPPNPNILPHHRPTVMASSDHQQKLLKLCTKNNSLLP